MFVMAGRLLAEYIMFTGDSSSPPNVTFRHLLLLLLLSVLYCIILLFYSCFFLSKSDKKLDPINVISGSASSLLLNLVPRPDRILASILYFIILTMISWRFLQNIVKLPHNILCHTLLPIRFIREHKYCGWDAWS